MQLPIYLDNNATTPVDPQVLDAMLPYFKEHFGNAASKQHPFGWIAEEAVDQGRQQVAALIGAKAKEIVFTSGATEANNLAIFGVAQSYRAKGNHLITAVTEHKAVLDPMAYLEKAGFDVTYLPVNRQGCIDLDRLKAAITEQTILISVMAANNEIGTLHPLEEIGRIAKERKVLFHTDAAQAVGKIPIDVNRMGIDLLSFSAHKFYGPKGIGALYVRARNPHVQLTAQILGGGHEHGFRSGTLAVPLIVGCGEACEIAGEVLSEEAERTRQLRDRLQDGIMKGLDGVSLNGDEKQRLPNNLNVSFAGVEAQAVMMKMDTVAVSSGSACTTASPEPSYVLRALGMTDDLAHAAIRFGIGRFTTEEEIDYAMDQVVKVVKELRK